MKKHIKNLARIFIICIVFQSLKCNIVFAKENTLIKTNAEIGSLKITNDVDYNLEVDEKSPTEHNNLSKSVSAKVNTDSTLASVSVNKVWKIKFNNELDINSVKNNVRIIDKDTNEESNISIDFQENNKTLSVSCKYSPNKNYTLIINKNVKSKTNKYLNSEISKDFITNKAIEATITHIADINLAIQEKEEFELPTTVDALMSDGLSKQVNVNWSDCPENIDVPGTYVFCGEVSGYEKKVLLNLIVFATPIEKPSDDNDLQPRGTLNKNLYDYLMNEENRQSVMKRAIQLHDGDLSNNCVYFSSEALRRAGLNKLPQSVCNTVQLTNNLKSMGWSISTDFSKLRPGDICFTKAYGYGPTHAYVFMKWVNPGKYDYAYICDNQGSEYDNQIYHKRNVNFATKAKDPTTYFMYKP
ncbi:Ig-like domain-containing protein [Clostridium tagluense]|uniref:Ig-like domain-containing protein n=1 Tax=Clostridium tagluense TaxID=360422 RepID=UPI001C6F4633|nr:Ig-like domain-containing protein [Clostridium tagluense]MBW9159201.1 Ig-like domain-containing protein [Clostridium tagluense]WLC68205.1 Ig-like domain-containing protein [Clostridium tagluense]